MTNSNLYFTLQFHTRNVPGILSYNKKIISYYLYFTTQTNQHNKSMHKMVMRTHFIINGQCKILDRFRYYYYHNYIKLPKTIRSRQKSFLKRSISLVHCNPLNRGRNNARSLDLTERICHLIGHKFSQFQVLLGHFVNEKLKIIKFPFPV